MPVPKLKVLLCMIFIVLILGAYFTYTSKVKPLNKHPKEEVGNPSAIYCIKLGYTYKTIKTENGVIGICEFPDGSSCNAWDFLNGKCGQKWSYCERTGGKIITDGNCSISTECAVCILPNGVQRTLNVRFGTHHPLRAYPPSG